MPIEVACPKCQHKTKVPTEWAGKKGTCPKCHAEVPIPEIAAAKNPDLLAPSPFQWLASTVNIIEPGAWLVGGLMTAVVFVSAVTTMTPELFAAALTLGVTTLAWVIACHVVRVLLSIEASVRRISEGGEKS